MATSGNLFTARSLYKKQARFAATGWTLLIFIACLWPGKELPQSDIPFIDKWVHFALFAPFCFLWLLSWPSSSFSRLFIILLFGCFAGFLVEIFQKMFPALGRNYDFMDILADAVGALLGVLLFALCARLSRRS